MCSICVKTVMAAAGIATVWFMWHRYYPQAALAGAAFMYFLKRTGDADAQEQLNEQSGILQHTIPFGAFGGPDLGL